MQIFNIGFPELVFIFLLALIVLGPQDLVKTGRQLGKLIRKTVNSDLWKSVLDTSREIRDLPQKLAREAGADELLEDLNKLKNAHLGDMDYVEKEMSAKFEDDQPVIDPGISKPPDDPAV
jgi:sec-independent protein translocase protein TatB